jgi:hypothetical protein
LLSSFRWNIFHTAIVRDSKTPCAGSRLEPHDDLTVGRARKGVLEGIYLKLCCDKAMLTACLDAVDSSPAPTPERNGLIVNYH